MIAVVDAGPLYAAANESDDWHQACIDTLQRPDLQLVIPALVVTEAACLVALRLGAQAEAAFLRGIATMDIEAPAIEDWSRMAELVETYADFPLGTADASVVALAERLGTDVIVTVDRRHFGAVRPQHVPAFRLLPE